MSFGKSAALIVQSLLESDDFEDSLNDVTGPPNALTGVHDTLFQTLIRLGVTGEQISTRYGDVYVSCRTWHEARQIAQAGPWKSMAEVTRMNPEHPDAREFPWLVDIPFGNLSGYIEARRKERLA